MRLLIAKLGATGDVVRTTPILRCFKGSEITWLTAQRNQPLIAGIADYVRCVRWEERELLVATEYDLIINLEDTLEVAQFLRTLRSENSFGAYADASGNLKYTDNSRNWFDMSLISRYGRAEADRLKLLNRQTYQELVFEGLGFRFAGERYLLPQALDTDLSGDVAIAAEAGPVWPMKKWAYYDDLKQRLEAEGLKVNFLPPRSSLLEHLGDVCSHRWVVTGDSLPMHFALGTGTRCVALFTCTSPWEIYGYGILKKIISPLLTEFFYKREYVRRATEAITVAEVLEAVTAAVAESSVQPPDCAETGSGHRRLANSTRIR